MEFLYKTTRGQLTILGLLSLLYLTDNEWYQISILVSVIPIGLLLYCNYEQTYWEREGMPFIPASFPFGVLRDLFLMRIDIAELMTRIYREIGREGYIGVYTITQPQLYIKDVNIIKNILVKDFSNFVDRGVYADTNVDPMTGNLFSLSGQPWRSLRAKISPTFTSGKLKTMYLTIKNIAANLKDYSLNKKRTSDLVDVKDLTGRFTLDAISSVALGLEGNNFKEADSAIRHATRLFSSPSLLQMIRLFTMLFCPRLASKLQVRLSPKSVSDYFHKITRDTINYRIENHIQRNDFLHLLMALDHGHTNGANVEQKGELSLTISEMAAQSFVFVVAGYDTSSATLSFLLYELALHPEIQEKLIEELDEAGSDISYEKLIKLTYLEMVLCETLRKHPPIPVLQRSCAEDYKLPDGNVIKAGTICVIPIYGLQKDPEYFPDPEKFDPERFSKENIDSITPYTYMPFGEGPRQCIGNRFAHLQIKLALVEFFSRFKVALCDKTPIPLRLEKKNFVYNPEGLWLRLVDREL